MDLKQFFAYIDLLLLRLWQSFLAYFPTFLGALILMLAGWLLAILFKSLTYRLLDNLGRILPRRAFQRGLPAFGVGQAASDVLSRIVYWIIIFIFVTAATEISGLPSLTTWLRGLVNYMPVVLVAVVIGLAGLIAGVLARDFVAAAASSANITYSQQLGKIAQIAIISITLMISIEQLGVDIQFLTVLIALVVGTVLIGSSVAFGLGAKMAVSNIIGCYYAQKAYKVGQTIEIGESKGRIVEISPVAIYVESSDGRVLIPGHRFSKITSIQLGRNEKDG